MRRTLPIAVIVLCSFGAVPAHARMSMAVGSYSGDGVSGRAITGLGFQPDVVLVKGDANLSTVLKSTTMTGPVSKLLGGTSGVLSDAVLALDNGWFTLGTASEVNGAGTTYYWVAFAASAGEMVVGSYTGDGSDDRWIDGLGLSPAYVIVMSEAQRPAMQRFDHQLSDRSLEFKNTGEKTDRIQDFEPDRFQVGKSTVVNEPNQIHHYVAWSQATGLITDSLYTGDGVAGRVLLGLGFEPDFALFQGLTNSGAVMRTSAAPGDATLPVDFGAAFADGIRGFQADGVELGLHKDVNQTGTQYTFVAFKGVDQADLQVTKSAGLPEATIGDTLDFMVSVSNLGPDGAQGILLTDFLQTGLTLVSSSSSIGTYSGETGVWTVGSLNEAESAELYLRTVVDAAAAGETIQNTARIAGKDLVDPQTENDSATVVVDLRTIPVLDPIGGQSVDEGQLLEFGVRAIDADGDSLHLAVEDAPFNSALVDSGMGTGSFRFTPDYAQAGTYSVLIIASDGIRADSEFVPILVNNVNRVPVLNPITNKLVAIGQRLEFEVYALDPDGETPALSAEYIPVNSSFIDYGDGTGKYQFDPQAGQIGVHNVLFIASDGLLADSVSVAITVVTTNLPPVLAPIGPQTVLEGAQLTVIVSATDPEGLYPSLEALILPTGATFVDHADGTGKFSFLPTFTQSGNYNPLFIASDGTLADSEWVTITVAEAGNQRPILKVTGSPIVAPGNTLHLDLSATDLDNPDLGISVFDAPLNTEFLDFGNNTAEFDFMPAPGQAGTHLIGFVASDGLLADTVLVSVSVVLGDLQRIEIAPDSATVSADALLQFTVAGYDNAGNPADAGSIEWGLTASLGTINPAGLLDPSIAGKARVFARSEFGPVDTSLYLEVTAGLIARLEIDPDTAALIVGESRQFAAAGLDAEGNTTPSGDVTWSVIGDIGVIDASGYFTAEEVGAGRVSATRTQDGMADTSGLLTVSQASLTHLIVTPDTASLQIGQAVTFLAVGYTATYEPASIGAISWSVIGDIGTVDASGGFTATSKGTGRIVAKSSVDNLADTSNTIVVDVLMAEELPLGNSTVHAVQERIPVLAFILENRFATSKGVTSFSIQDVSIGQGTPGDVRSNIPALSLFSDANGNRVLDLADQLLGSLPPSALTTFDFAAVSVPPVSRRAFFVAHNTALILHDGDSLDFALNPAAGVVTTDGSTVGGDDEINSLGVSITDGLTASQINLIPTGNTSLAPEDGLTSIMMIDVPRDGYASDVLEVLSIINHGTAVPGDFDSVLCYADDGNGVWDGAADELRLGSMLFTGGLWSLSGLSMPVTSAQVRLYIAAQISAYASNGATLVLGVPLHGIEMSSANDGPIDSGVPAIETITILASQGVTVSTLPIPAQTLIPGRTTDAIAGFVLVNGLSSDLAVTALECGLLLSDPRGAELEMLQSQIDSVSIWLDRDGEIRSIGPPDSLLSTATLSGSTVRFNLGSLALYGRGAQVRLAVRLHLNARNCRDGNLVNATIASETDVEFQQSVTITGAFPLKNPIAHQIEAFPVVSTTIYSAGGGSLYAGQSRFPVLDFDLPRNGYSTDVLSSLRVINRGSLDDATALTTVDLWADAQNDGFDNSDSRLGSLVRTANEWWIGGLAYPLALPNNRLIITVDIPNGLVTGGTLDLEVPIRGVTCESGMDGPDDQPMRNAQPDLVFPSDRITVIATPRSPEVVLPGSRDNRLLGFALYNGYRTQQHILTAVAFSNETRAQNGATAADSALGTVSLYRSADLTGPSGAESLIATGQFSGGSLRLSGLSQILPPEQLTYFLARVDVPLAVTDGDSLAIRVRALTDFEFSSSVDINGEAPSGAAAPLIINGSVAGQYIVSDVPTGALTSGQVNAPVFEFTPARNGQLADALVGLTLVNEGTAGPNDLLGLTLWQDADASGGWSEVDLPIAAMTYASGQWTSGIVDVPVGPTTPPLLVTADVSSTASPDASVRFAVPLLGCQYASANDGPLDQDLAAPRWLYISAGSLTASLSFDRTAFSIGQHFQSAIEVTNRLPITVTDLIVREIGAGASSAVRLDSVLGGGTALQPGARTTVRYFYTAANVGRTYLRYRAVTPALQDSSSIVESPEVVVQSAPAPIAAALTSSIPAAVTRGQKNVFPLTIVLENSSGVNSAPVHVESLSLSAREYEGAALSLAAIASRLVLRDEEGRSTTIDDVPDEPRVVFRFAEPSVLQPGEAVRYSLLLDVDDEARLGQFRLMLDDADALVIQDANTQLPVPFTEDVIFPMVTSVCRVLKPAAHLAVGASSIVGDMANRGQPDLGILRFQLSNAGDAVSAQLMLTRLTCQFTGADEVPVNAGELFSQVRLTRSGFTLAQISDMPEGQTSLSIDLSAPLILSPGETALVELRASVHPAVSADGFRAVISDSTAFVARDLSSGLPRLAVSDELAAADSAVFPIQSSYAAFRDPAVPLTVCLESALPSTVINGSDGVALARVLATYVTDPRRSPIVLDEIRFFALDTLGRVLDPLSLFDRVGFRIDAGPVQYLNSFTLSQGAVQLTLLDGGLRLEPGDNKSLELIGDLEADAPYDHFLLFIEGATSLRGHDATDAGRGLAVTGGAGCNLNWPFSTRPAGIILPAGRPVLQLATRPPRLVSAGSAATLLEASLDYSAGASQGTLLLGSLSIHVTERDEFGSRPIPFGNVFDSLTLWIDGSRVAVTSALDSDSAHLLVDPPIQVAHGSTPALAVEGTVKRYAPPGNYTAILTDSAAVELHDAQLGVRAYAASAEGPFPISGYELSVAEPGVSASFSTFPNPFIPSREEAATVGYVLPADAEVDITIFSVTGTTVRRLVEGAQQAAGPHSSDRWDGRDDNGDLVVPGTYFCQLRAVLVTQATETHRRKVVVLR